jgi:YHS domain-containing protein
MLRFPNSRKLLPGPRFSLRTLMLVVTLVAVGLWWGQRAVFFRQMAERHRVEANIYRALQQAHPTMTDKCTAIVKYHAGLEAIYRNAVYTPWMIIYEHPYETSVVSEVKLVIDTASPEPEPLPAVAKPVLGLDGYCPVTLAEHSRWQKGSPKLAANFQGITYQFAGADELQTFLEEPQRYAPAYGGNDIVRLVDEQQNSPGDCDYGLCYENRIYLFASEKTLAAFQSNPKKYVAQADSALASR